MNYEVIVVGAGPGGATAARRCAERGLRVALIEKHQQLGMKLCAGGLDYRILTEFQVDRSVVQSYPHKTLICTPSGRTLTKEIRAAITDRKDFDQYLTDCAVDAGATLLVSTRCLGVLKKGRVVKGIIVETSKGKTKLLGNVVIAADGFQSITAKSADLHPNYRPCDYALTVQTEIFVKSEMKTDAKYLFYGKDISPCGFGWIFPRRHSYAVGLGTLVSRLKRGQLIRSLEYLIHKHPIASKILSGITEKSRIQAACIPLKPISNICSDGILLVGDAAGQVSPLNGDGIYYAMKAGLLAGDITAKAVTKGDVTMNTLREYQKRWFLELGNELIRKKSILEFVEPYFNIYIEAKNLLESHVIVKRFYEKGLALANLYFKLGQKKFKD